MTLKTRTLTGALAFVCLCAAAEGDAPAPLTKEEMATAGRSDDFSIPMPAELMAALNKQGKPDWAAEFRAPISTDFGSRAQLALNLGGLVADGFVAVEAEDSQQVKNLGKDILKLAKNLGVPKDIIMRGSSITDFAERKEWEALKEELEATENEVKDSLHENKDGDLVSLVSVGAWLRGVQVISDHVAKHYSEASGRILRQPTIVTYMNKKLDALPDKMRDDPTVKAVRVKLIEMEPLVSFPREQAPSLEDVKKLNALASEIVKGMAKKDTK